jgi:exodeoxyribonuclease V alpha subunit
VKILALLLEQAGDRLLHIALAAPTGKAAARLIEAVCAAGNDLSLSDSIRAQIPQEAVTIHRLLRPLPGSVSFRYNAGNPLPFDVVVIDESSMVDLPLMAKLVAAIKPGSRLILLGDRDQLSSVEAGAVLGDICNHDWQNRFSPDFHAGAATIGGLVVSGAPAADAPPLADCVVTLWKSHRFSASSGIAAVSGLVNEGRGREALELMQSGTAGDIIWHELPSPDELPHRLKPVISEGYGPYLAETDPLTCLDRFGTFRIVTPIRQGPYGVQEVNAVTERILGLKKKVSGHDWYLYRPVMVSRNDYQLGLANGDTGLALPGENGEGMTVCFPTAVGGIRRFSTLALQSCDTVFTMTIHKSQGSEFDALLILLPPGCGEIMTRELLYTALTRGRKRVEIWGDSSSFIAGAARRTERNSGLRERLWGA